MRRAFTLLELLIVIAIIGILAAMVLVALTTARKRAKDTRIKSDIRQLANTANIYGLAHNGNYDGWCEDFDSPSQSSGKDENHTRLIDDIAAQGVASIPWGNRAGVPACYSDYRGWAIASKLLDTNQGAICTDYTGVTSVGNDVAVDYPTAGCTGGSIQ